MQPAVALMAEEASLPVSAVLGGGTLAAASIAGGATHEALLGSIEALADAPDTQGKAQGESCP